MSTSTKSASGWLRRVTSETDRRVKYVELTEEGIALVRAVSPKQARDVRAKVFSKLDAVQVAQLSAISLAIVGGLDGEQLGGGFANSDGGADGDGD